MDKAVEEELGFDLDDPAVLSSIHGATGGAERSAGLGIGGIGYRETFFAPESEPNAPVVPSDEPAARDAADGPDVAAAPMPATPPVQAPPVQAPPVQAPPVQAGQQTVGIMIALGLVVLVAVTFVVIRRGRSATLGVPGDSPSRV
jgi:nucleoid-associated protein YgaU